MSDETTTQTSEETPDGVESTDTATPETVDGQLGDAGKKALQALRAEVKELRSKLKAFESPADAARDASESGDSPSDGASESASDVDGERVATTADDVKPTGRMSLNEYKDLSPDERAAIPQERRPRFMGTGEGGAYNPRPSKDRQLTKHELSGMPSWAIEKARRNGQLRDLLSGK
jgi:hypothetical protein